MARGIEPSEERGKRIQDRRHQLYLSSTEVAAAVGVSVRTLEGWEQGAGITRPNLRSLAEALECDPAELQWGPSTSADEAPEGQSPTVSEDIAGRVTDLERELGAIRQILLEVVALLADGALGEKDEALDHLSEQLGPTSLHPVEEPDEGRGQ